MIQLYYLKWSGWDQSNHMSPWWTSNLQNCNTVNVYCLNHKVYGNLVQQQYQNNILLPYNALTFKER